MIAMFSLLSLTTNQRCGAMQILWIEVEGGNLFKIDVQYPLSMLPQHQPMKSLHNILKLLSKHLLQLKELLENVDQIVHFCVASAA